MVAALKSQPNLHSHALARKTTASGSAVTVAARYAEQVDKEGRFPVEAISALKAEGRMSMLVPPALGGEGARFEDVMDLCYALGGVCSSTALIFAMHQVKVACLVRHVNGNPWQEDFLRRLARDQLLLASSTTEGQGGGNVRASAAPITTEGGQIGLERDATVMSYGRQADAVVTTARRAPDAEPADQVLAVFERADYRLEGSAGWDTLGMRGTDSAGFQFSAKGVPEQIVSETYSVVHAASMVPAAHLFWSSVWAGIAAGAVERARLHTRKAMRLGGSPPGAAHLTQAMGLIQHLNAAITASLDHFEARSGDLEALMAPDFQTEIHLLKVEVSERATAAVLSALRACGLSGYRNDHQASLGRALRDILSAPLMINNDRILANLSASVLVSPMPSRLRGA